MHRNGDRLLDLARVGQVQALDLVRRARRPSIHCVREQLGRVTAPLEEQEVAQRVRRRSRRQLLVGLREDVDRAGRCRPGCADAGRRLPVETWMASDAGVDEPLAHLDRLVKRCCPRPRA